MTDATKILKKTADAIGETTADAVGEAAGRAADSVAAATAEHPESIDALLVSAEVVARDLGEAATAYARREPIRAILWAAGAGALAMALIQLATADRREVVERRRSNGTRPRK